MERIDDIEAFLAVVEQGGLSAAARRLGRSVQAVSRSLAALEAGVGVELVRRTTRRVSATEAGEAFYRRMRPAFDEMIAARLEAANRAAEPSGILRISAPVTFAPAHLMPLIAAFMEAHPGVSVDLRLSDQFSDLVAGDFDLAIRIGNLTDSDLKMRRLGDLRRVVFGSPRYFAAHGRPQHPRDLARHQCIVRTSDGSPGKWPFRIDGRPAMVAVAGRFRTDATAAIYAAVKLGLGLGFTPLWQIRDLVEQGDVKPVLTEFETLKVPIQAVWPATRLPAAKSQLFVEFLVANLCDPGP